MSGGTPVRLGSTSPPLYDDFPRFNVGRFGSLEFCTEETEGSSSVCCFFVSFGRSGSSSPLSALAVELSPLSGLLWSVGRSGSGAVPAPEFDPEFEPDSAPLSGLLCSVGRSGSGGADGVALPLLPELESSAGCLRCSTGWSLAASSSFQSCTVAGLGGLGFGKSCHFPYPTHDPCSWVAF